MLIVGITVLVQHLEDCDLHHTLIEVRGFIFDYFHRDDLVGLHVLALYNLPERALAQNIENEVLVALLCAQPIIDIKDIVVVLVVITIVMTWFTRFRQNTPRVVRGFVSEPSVARPVRVDDVSGELAERRQIYTTGIQSSIVLGNIESRLQIARVSNLPETR